MTRRKTDSRRIATAERRAEALKLRKEGVPAAEIAQRLGYRQTAHLYQDLDRALAAMMQEPAAAVRALELARLDDQLVRLAEREARVLEVRDREHLTVSHGRVVTVTRKDPETGVETEVPLIDDEPVLRATAQLLTIEGKRLDIATRRAKYEGLDAPTRLAVITDEALDDAIAEEKAALAELERAAADEADDPEGDEAAEG